MADDANLPITDPYQVPVVFTNQLVGSGFLNGNLNLTFATARFTPNGDGIEPDLVITSRLRMDLFCAQQLYERLGKIIAETVKNETKQ
jgi:hypothetical protein